MSDLYAEITGKIVSMLEAGVSPWAIPWDHQGKAGKPIIPLRHNGVPYRGMNKLILWYTQMERGYHYPNWLTYKQANALGGHVAKGEVGTRITYADSFKKRNEDTGEEDEIYFLKAYTVFNTQQCNKLPEQYYPEPKASISDEFRLSNADIFMRNTKAEIKHGGHSAYYVPEFDYIQLPPFVSFTDPAAYYGTAMHELVHWTGHKDRLNRLHIKKGTPEYAQEELVAEIGSAYVCADLGIAPEPREENAAYLGAWLKRLKEDKRAIFRASADAQRAADWLHQLQPKPLESQPA